MSEPVLTNLDIKTDGKPPPQYIRANTTGDVRLYQHHSTNVDNTNKSMTIVVQNPFEDPSNVIKYLHDSTSDDLSIRQSSSRNLIPHHVRFNQELLNNFGIDIPISKQQSETASLIPLPSTLSNNLLVNNHHINQPTMFGTFPIHQSSSQTMNNNNNNNNNNNFDNHHHMPTSIYINTRPIAGKINQQIRPAPVALRYPTMMQTQQQYGHQMIPQNAFGIRGASPQVIMQQQQHSSIGYDPNTLYRRTGLQTQNLPSGMGLTDDNILKTLLQINPQVSCESGLKSRPGSSLSNGIIPDGIDHVFNPNTIVPNVKAPKSRKKRKANDMNTSFDDEIPAKSRKRKKKGTDQTKKSVEHSLQQLRDLPMLIPVEPSIDMNNNLSDKKYQYQGRFGHVFIENLSDYYRPYRRPPIKQISSTLDRHYRLCSNSLDRPPCLPSPPLITDTSDKLSELLFMNDEESIISTSTIADDENIINNIQAENVHLLKTLTSDYNKDLQPLSPILISNEMSTEVNIKKESSEFDVTMTSCNEQEKDDQAMVEAPNKVSVTLTLTTEAANNVQSVIAAVADLLRTAYPSTLDVHQTLTNNHSSECTTSTAITTLNPINPLPSHPINRGASTYKIGSETSVSIQSLIDMPLVKCQYCSQNLISTNLFKKRVNESTSNSQVFHYFCNEQCYNTNIKNESIDPNLPLYIPKRNLHELNNKQWKRWNSDVLLKSNVELPSDIDDIEQLITDIKIPLLTKDKRICVFCNGIEDMSINGPGRLLNLHIGQWCHINCAFWSSEVYETVSGALMSVEQAFTRSINTECVICEETGGSLTCFYQRCSNTYHFTCATENGCVFYKNKTIMCPTHALKTTNSDQILEDKSVLRKVWINRDEIKQIQNYMNEEHEDKSYTLRIGSLVLHHIGQLLPHQLQSSAFHNRNFIYPVGYSITRFYWSMRHPNRRCAYRCSIIDIDTKPMFQICVQENEDEQAQEFLESSAKAVWHKVVDEIDLLRQKHGLVKMFPVFVNGEDLYGLTEPHITRLIESLPGVEMLQNYAFKYGRLQLFDMPLTVNPTGCARTEPKLHTHFRRHAQTLTSLHSSRSALPRTVFETEATQIPYVKQFVLSKSTQYRKLKIEWRQNVVLAKSRIQGLGLFAARDLEKHTMIIEYIGELIRNEVANKREKFYEEQNHGIYMFRLDEEHVIDATLSGCLARYINHSCEPNAITEVVQIEKDNKIIIITNRRIPKGEEIMYDYKFDFEDDSKIPCSCGATNCRKWMN